jgi:hypothetical protein
MYIGTYICIHVRPVWKMFELLRYLHKNLMSDLLSSMLVVWAVLISKQLRPNLIPEELKRLWNWPLKLSL